MIFQVFQVFNLVPWLSAVENVLLSCEFSRRRRKRLNGGPKQTARRLLHELGLDDALLANPAMSLSVGQQQRVAAARALLGAPQLILADEPTSALDEETKAWFVDLLRRECAEAGAGLLFVSHDRGLESHFDRVVEFADLSWDTFEMVEDLPQVTWAVPISIGDNHRGFPVIGTGSDYFRRFRHSGGQSLKFAAGGFFVKGQEAVIGSEVVDRFGYGRGTEILGFYLLV